jgi:hypothetical protein
VSVGKLQLAAYWQVERMSIYFASVGTGLGDVIVALPIIEHLIRNSRQRVYLVERGPRQEGIAERINGIGGSIREQDMRLTAQDRLINLRDHSLLNSWNWGSDKFALQYPGWKINDIQRAICRDFGLEIDFATLVPLRAESNPTTADKILLVPGTTSDFKAWPADHWRQLHFKLVERGWRTAVLGEPQRSPVVSDLVASGLQHYPTPTISEAIDAISAAPLVVAVDTGLMHIAVQQGVQTIALMNNLNLFLREVDHCCAISSPRCHQICIPDHGDHPQWPIYFSTWQWADWDYKHCRMPADQHCMQQISVESVLEKSFQMLAGRRRLPVG